MATNCPVGRVIELAAQSSFPLLSENRLCYAYVNNLINQSVSSSLSYFLSDAFSFVFTWFNCCVDLFLCRQSGDETNTDIRPELCSIFGFVLVKIVFIKINNNCTIMNINWEWLFTSFNDIQILWTTNTNTSYITFDRICHTHKPGTHANTSQRCKLDNFLNYHSWLRNPGIWGTGLLQLSNSCLQYFHYYCNLSSTTQVYRLALSQCLNHFYALFKMGY